jgi:hypothetical protein
MREAKVILFVSIMVEFQVISLFVDDAKAALGKNMGAGACVCIRIGFGLRGTLLAFQVPIARAFSNSMQLDATVSFATSLKDRIRAISAQPFSSRCSWYRWISQISPAAARTSATIERTSSSIDL